MNTRPPWTLPEKSNRLWIADDATTDPADRETVAQAWGRLFEGIEIPQPVAVWNPGDAYYRLLPTGHVLVESHWGTSEIRLIRQADQMRLLCKHDWKTIGHRDTSDPLVIEALYACETCSSWTYHKMRFVGYQRESLEHRIDDADDPINDDGGK